MKRRRTGATALPRAGFTLAEVLVAVLIVGITLTLCSQGGERTKFTAAHTRNMKLARELGLITLGQIESGIYWEDLESGYGASYAEEGFPDFFYEIVLADDEFFDRPDQDDEYDDGRRFDTWAYQEQQRRDADDYDEELEEEEEQPYEKVKVRVTYPSFGEQSNEVVLERWIPWDQVYGVDPDELDAGDSDGGGSLGGEDGTSG